MQDNGPGNGGKDRFQTHRQRGNGRRGILLSYNLQCIGHAAAKHARIQQRPLGLPNARKRNVLSQERNGQRHQARHKELRAAERNAIRLGRKVPYHHNVAGKQQRAGQHQPIAPAQ